MRFEEIGSLETVEQESRGGHVPPQYCVTNDAPQSKSCSAVPTVVVLE